MAPIKTPPVRKDELKWRLVPRQLEADEGLECFRMKVLLDIMAEGETNKHGRFEKAERKVKHLKKEQRHWGSTGSPRTCDQNWEQELPSRSKAVVK